jgi:GH25 family lysozyme M1 (1,4-beta-N-acetylmuramidase)
MTKLKGIDVSEHNGVIDWDKVKADGIQFAMIRMGFGSDIKSQDDKQFERNVRECDRLGIPWGAYLYSYALTVEQAKSEAAHALRLLKGKKPSYPIAFDMEDADGYKKKHGMPNNATLVAICDTFLSAVEKAGYYAVLYASKSWFDNQLKGSKLDRYDKWVAQWGDKCTYSGTHNLWQFTNSGVVKGINGRVDMNYAYLDFPSIINHKLNTTAKDEVKPITLGPFKDVPADRWSAPAIQRLKEKGIFRGRSDGSFGPTDCLSREEAAVVIDNVLKYISR